MAVDQEERRQMTRHIGVLLTGVLAEELLAQDAQVRAALDHLARLIAR
jgi:hypothetical protein